MNIKKFIKLKFPEEYNFELENELVKKSKLDIYERYFVYRASKKTARSSHYENGLKYAEKTYNIFGEIADCDGSLDIKTCILSREIYRKLWGWTDIKEDELQRYGLVFFKEFGLMGPETMNSAQTIINNVIEHQFNKCNDTNITTLKKGKISINFIIELFSNKYSNKILINWLDNVNGLKQYLNNYHTLGNFVLVPAYFNPYRASVTFDYWDKSLILLKNKKKTDIWKYQNKEKEVQIKWDNKLYIKYINYFFLWDYTNDYKPIIISDFKSKEELETFLDKTMKKINHRGQFMMAMLKIEDINPTYYMQLVKNIFYTDNKYKGYKEVIDAIKKEPCYSNKNIKKIIDSLQELT